MIEGDTAHPRKTTRGSIRLVPESGRVEFIGNVDARLGVRKRTRRVIAAYRDATPIIAQL